LKDFRCSLALSWRHWGEITDMPLKYFVFTLVIALCAAPCFSQSPAYSHGTQPLRNGYEECLGRAEAALNAEGFRVDDRDEEWRGGSKGAMRAEIVCTHRGDDSSSAHILVVGNSAGGSPDNERARLQQRMEPEGSRPIRVSATSENLIGRWNWVATCQNSTPSGRLDITSQRQGGFSGAFSNSGPTDTGTIEGEQQGLLVEFRRQIPKVGEQRWTGGVERNGGGLRMEGRIEGTGGPCTFSATTANAGTPRTPGGSTNVAGMWNWTAACNGSQPSGRFEIVNQRRDGSISGVFSNAGPTDTGTIDGRQQGLFVDFRRLIPGAGEQRWIGGLSAAGGVLTMEGRIDGAGGPCTFSAMLTR
jgi:hypothetical protein